MATLVDGASEPEELIHADGGKSKTGPERKAHTINVIQNTGRDMKLLSCADKLANLRDIIRDYDRLGDEECSTSTILCIPDPATAALQGGRVAASCEDYFKQAAGTDVLFFLYIQNPDKNN
ncbi:MAG: hypothetical protein SCH39_13415 [Methanosarcinales archaeon]|nr:hypothetical protein [Methanosarcinales archaeon]